MALQAGEPELSRHLCPVPVTPWGTAQEAHHHISRVFFSQPQKVILQPGIHSDTGHESLVNVPHHSWHLEEARGGLGVLSMGANSPASAKKLLPSHHTLLASKAEGAQWMWLEGPQNHGRPSALAPGCLPAAGTNSEQEQEWQSEWVWGQSLRCPV